MARRQKNKRLKRWLFWVVFLVLLVVAGVVVYFVWNEYFRVDDENKKDDIVETVEEINDDLGKGGEEIVEKEKVVLYEGEDPNEAEELTGVVTYAGVNGGNLMIRVNIDQYLGSGTCGLNLLLNGVVVYSDTANIIDSATTSTCEGFNVPASSLNSGNYQIEIKMNSGDKNGIIRGEVNI